MMPFTPFFRLVIPPPLILASQLVNNDLNAFSYITLIAVNFFFFRFLFPNTGAFYLFPSKLLNLIFPFSLQRQLSMFPSFPPSCKIFHADVFPATIYPVDLSREIRLFALLIFPFPLFRRLWSFDILSGPSEVRRLTNPFAARRYARVLIQERPLRRRT